MKALIAFLAIPCLVLNAGAQTSPTVPRASASPTPIASDLTLKSGTVFHEAVITSADPAYATVRYRGGISRIDLADLPDDLRRKIAPAYDPRKAAVFRAADDQASEETSRAIQAQTARAEAEASRAEQLRVAIAKAGTLFGRVLSVVPGDGVLINGLPVGEYQPGGVTFLRGYKQEVVDGDFVPPVKIIPDGTYQYTTALGAAATVRAYRFVGFAPDKKAAK